MLKCEQKVATTSGASAVICKIQNMPWLKRDIASTHPKSNEQTEGKMLKTLPQKEKDEQNASEKKDKKRQRKSKKPVTERPPKTDVKYRGNAKSKSDEQKNNRAGKQDIKVPQYSILLGKKENAWNPAKNAAESLFPNAESIVTEVNEQELLERVLKESEMTAYLEQCAMDPPQDEAAAKSTEEPESEAEWGKVQRNLPTPEPEKELQISDRNNNSGLPPIENLTVPAVKLERRNQSLSTETDDIKTPLVPAIAPKYIDKYGRVDGCTEKRLFMGKGARFKEQEYLKQLQQQQQQLKGPALLPDPPILPSNSSDTYSDLSNAFSQVFLKEDDAPNSLASCESHNETVMDALEEACGYSQDFTENAQEFNSQSEVIVDDSQYHSRSVDQIISEMEAISNSSQYPDSEELSSQKFDLPAKEFMSVFSGEAPTLSENDYVLPTLHSRIEPQAFVKTSVASSAQNLKQETQDSSLQDTGAQAKQNLFVPEQTSGQEKQNSHIPEQTPPAGRPIVSGANSNNYQQRRYQSSGISVNRGGYHDSNAGDRNFNKAREYQGQYDRGSRPEQYSGRTYGRGGRNDFGAPKDDRNHRRPQGEPNNYRNPRYEQNPHKYGEQNRGYQNGPRVDHHSQKWDGESKGDYQKGPRGDYNSQKWSGEQNRDFQSGLRVDQTSQKWEGEQKRDFQKVSNVDRSSQKWDGEQKRDFQKVSNVDRSSQKWDGEQKRDFQKVSNVDRSSQKWDGEQKRDFARRSTDNQIPHKSDDQNRDFLGGLKGDRSSYKPDGEQKRDNHKLPTADTNPFKSVEESNKNANNNEYHAHSQMDKKPPVSVQGLNMNASPKEETHTWPADVAINDPRRSLENVPSTKVKNQPDFNDTSSNISEIPDISNFGSRFSTPPQIQDFMTEMISVPPVIPPPTNSFSVASTNSFSVAPSNTFPVAPTNPFVMASAPRYPEISSGAGLKDNLQYSSSHFSAPPGFQSLGRSIQPPCVYCTPEMSLEARCANLRVTDPLLFRLLQQKEAANSRALMKFPVKPENSNAHLGNLKVHGSCPNCSCNSQSSRNFYQETMTPEVNTCHSEEEERAQFQLWHRSNPPPINPYLGNPVAAQHPETLQMGHRENAQWTAPIMRHPNIPHHENLQIVTCLIDAAGNTFPVNYPMGYQHVQRPINVQPRGEELQGFLPTGYENLPLDVERLMQQKLLTHQYENASVYPMQPTIGRYPHQGAQIPMPFPPHKYDADIAAMSRSNVAQSNVALYPETEHHQTNAASTGVDMNNEEEFGKPFPLGRGAGKKANFQPVPIKGRGRAKDSQKN